MLRIRPFSRGGRVARKAKIASEMDALQLNADSYTVTPDTARRYTASIGEAADAKSNG